MQVAEARQPAASSRWLPAPSPSRSRPLLTAVNAEPAQQELASSIASEISSTTESRAPSPSTSNGAAAEAPPTSPRRGARIMVQDMVKHFKTRRGMFKAVDGVSVTLEPGTITTLLGPSGSGKTTLLRLIAGLEEPTSGSILFDGADVTSVPIQDRDLGVVFQGYALFKHMTVAKNIAFGPRIRKLEVDIESKVRELLQLIELGELGGRYPPQLSGGQKQRVAVARALACDPRVLLLDEPFGALDPVVRKSLRSGLQAIVKKLGVTTILVTHDQEEAWDLSDSVVVFNRGRVEQVGTPKELAASPASPFVMNFVSDVAHVPAGSQLVKRMEFECGAKSHVMLRPGDVEVFQEFSQPRICPAMVADKANVGWAVRYWLKYDDGVELEWGVSRAVDAESYDLDVGQRVYTRIDPERMMAFDYSDLDTSALP